MIISFGKKYKGREMEDVLKVDRGYVEWIANPREGGFKPYPQFIEEAKRLLETPILKEDTSFNTEDFDEKQFAKDEFKMEVLQALEEFKQKVSEM